jgi:hypothetical protein
MRNSTGESELTAAPMGEPTHVREANGYFPRGFFEERCSRAASHDEADHG